MVENEIFEVLVIGGGLAGLTAALHLSRSNIKVCLIEKNQYPNHKVCGEYVSNEVLSYLNSLGIDPYAEGAKNITSFEITNANGKQIRAKLPLGGFGISRFYFDNLIYNNLREKAEIIFDSAVNITLVNNRFEVSTQKGNQITADFVIGAFRKRSNLDSFLNQFLFLKSL